MAKKGIKVKKQDNFSEWYTQAVQFAELADIRYDVQGFIVHLPWGFKLARKIYSMFEEEVEADGHEPFLLPTVIPEENLNKEKEHAGFVPDVFWVTEAGTAKLERRLALRPTGETQIYPMYSLWIRSYNQLPFKRYQSRITTFRNESHTRPFLRGREFMFFETHDVFADNDGVMKQVKTDMKIMERVARERLFIPFIFFKRPQWDKFKGANDSYASDSLVPDGRRIQIGTTHDLGQNFAKAFDIKFKDEKGKDSLAYQTCFGPGIWRLLASLIAIHGDDNGLILPFEVAPLQIVIVPITFAGKKADNLNVLKKGKELAEMLKEMGYRVYFDDRDEVSPGEKYNVWELKGVPLRLEIGPREVKEEVATCVRRNDKVKDKISVEKHIIGKEIEDQRIKLDKKIKKDGEQYFKDNTKEAKNFKELKETIKKHRGFVKVPFCSMDFEGQECADKLKAETEGGEVCGTLLKEEKVPKGAKCAVCGKKANHMTYVAKSI